MVVAILSIFQVLANGTAIAVLLGGVGFVLVGIATYVLARLRGSWDYAIGAVAFAAIGAMLVGASADRMLIDRGTSSASVVARNAADPTAPGVFVDSLAPAETSRWAHGSAVLGGQSNDHSLYAQLCPSKKYSSTWQTLDLGGKYNWLTATVALAPDSRNTTPLLFEANADNARNIFSHAVSLQPVPVRISVRGVQQLKLVVKADPAVPVNKYGCGEVDMRPVWGNPYLEE
jgi:hypothetical protein